MASRRSLCVVACLGVLAACDDDPTGVTGPGRIDLPHTIFVAPGDSVPVNAIVRDADGDPVSADVVLTSSDETIATVDANGFVHGVAFGAAELTATSGELSAQADIAVQLPAAAVRIELGDWHSCWLGGGGAAECWGQGGVGQLGGGALPTEECNASACATRPAEVAGGRSYTSIASGAAHACAITVFGEAYCWGVNYDGVLGVPPTGTCEFDAPCNVAPSRVGPDIVFRSIVAGAYYTCGLDMEGGAWCWGANGSGNIGDGTQEFLRTEPVEVAGGHTFVALSAGTSHACGIDDSGAVFCWGSRMAGQVGDGVSGGESEPAWAPVAVLSDESFVAVSAGDGHTCAIADDGAAWCWGLNADGQLGTSESDACPGFFGTFPCSPTPVAVEGGLTFQAIAAGGNHTCGVTTTHDAFCWGSNLAGQLGTGSYELDSESSPVEVMGHQSWEGVSAGLAHSCAVTAGTRDVYCWGDNFLGQLGLGDTEAVPAPTAVLP